MIEASTQFMVGRLSTESGKCNRFNLDGIFGNDRLRRYGNGRRAAAASRHAEHRQSEKLPCNPARLGASSGTWSHQQWHGAPHANDAPQS